ncbi:MAG: hypothetical protein KC422_08985 [Trueperaceae bacterium]|nr:hypothetical protein [Trueperaceae bacterium]
MTIEQIVAISGDGKLSDDSTSSEELRTYFKEETSTKLFHYIDYCLSNSFLNSGFVLQDLVNELGRRLDFEVQNGLYRGRKSAIGSDGLWTSPEGNHLVVEVKTTDTYRISLDTIASYKQKLLESGKVSDLITILIVVGREDTGELEAQVRGSRHAWDIRLISTDALSKLVEIKEGAESIDTLQQIREILIPFEYTRIDKMVELLFTAAKDVESSVEVEQGLPIQESSEKPEIKVDQPDHDFIQKKREEILAAFERVKNLRLVKKTRATYWDLTRTLRVACTVSKRYEGKSPYWYAYHPSWHSFLQEGEIGFFILGCSDLNFAFSIPLDALTPLLEKMNTTEKENGKMYWHIKIAQEENGNYSLLIPNHPDNLSLTPFRFTLPTLAPKVISK